MADAVKCMLSDPSIKQSILDLPFLKMFTENNPMCKDIIEKQLEDLAPQINQEYLQNAFKFMSNFGEDKIKEEIKNGNNDIKDSQNDNNNTEQFGSGRSSLHRYDYTPHPSPLPDRCDAMPAPSA